MPDVTTLPTPAQAVDLVAAFRAWQSADPTTGPDEPMAAALFAAFPGENPYDDERCVTVDGFALVAKRDRRPDGTEVFDLEHYALDGKIDARGPVTRPQSGNPPDANPHSDLPHASRGGL